MGCMPTWKPDPSFINGLEKLWTEHGTLDEPYGNSLEGMTVQDITDLLRMDDRTDLALYLEGTYQIDQPLCDHHYSGRETLEAMRNGIPYGVFVYSVLYQHKDCCVDTEK